MDIRADTRGTRGLGACARLFRTSGSPKSAQGRNYGHGESRARTRFWFVGLLPSCTKYPSAGSEGRYAQAKMTPTPDLFVRRCCVVCDPRAYECEMGAEQIWQSPRAPRESICGTSPGLGGQGLGIVFQPAGAERRRRPAANIGGLDGPPPLQAEQFMANTMDLASMHQTCLRKPIPE
jgi:hypothetical protein